MSRTSGLDVCVASSCGADSDTSSLQRRGLECSAAYAPGAQRVSEKMLRGFLDVPPLWASPQAGGTARLRTPEARFQVATDAFPYLPIYVNVTDPSAGGAPLRMAVYDEGPRDAAEIVWLQHGEPTWSYLFRATEPGLLAAGHRAVMLDLVGFGRSDKPTRQEDYSYARHVEWVREALFARLQLSGLTFFGHDWGSLVGLRLLAAHPDRFRRAVVGNGGLPSPLCRRGELRWDTALAFGAWRAFAQLTPVFRASSVVAFGTQRRLQAEARAAYDAPFPDEDFLAGARAFPRLVPTSATNPASQANRVAWNDLRRWNKPFLTLFSDGDPITRSEQRATGPHPGAQKGCPTSRRSARATFFRRSAA